MYRGEEEGKKVRREMNRGDKNEKKKLPASPWDFFNFETKWKMEQIFKINLNLFQKLIIILMEQHEK